METSCVHDVPLTHSAANPMLDHVDFQTPPPARSATVTDDISPGQKPDLREVLRVRGGMEALPGG